MFLIPYGLMLVVVGLPLVLMELMLGQFPSLGLLSCWKVKLSIFFFQRIHQPDISGSQQVKSMPLKL